MIEFPHGCFERNTNIEIEAQLYHVGGIYLCWVSEYWGYVIALISDMLPTTKGGVISGLEV